jgi:SAM-dependent methyltransferase
VLGSAGPGASTNYAAADATRLPFPSNSFDVVTCQTLLIHVPAARAVVDEFLRVLRPGGLLAVAEPNNIANVAAMSLCDPRPPLVDYLGLIELQWICEAGKLALGDGESSIGERLPSLFAEAGLEDVRTYGSDKCATLVPPYAGTQRLDLDTVAGWAREETWMFVGDEARARELFAAGGGAPEDFERLWGCVRRHLERFRDAAERGEVAGARGIAMYLVSGRLPA